MSGWEADLVVLVPDKNMEASVRALLSSRPEALGIRRLRFDVYVHIERDPGCLLRGHDFLRPMVRQCARGLVLFDRIGSGQEGKSRQELEGSVTEQLSLSGWGDRAVAVVLDPELEAWIWSDSPHVDRSLGWEGQQPSVRGWLQGQGMWQEGADKPLDPKAALEKALRHVRKRRSSAIYEQLAENVGLKRCADPAFLRFRRILADWFPVEAKT